MISAPGEKTCQQTFDKLNQVESGIFWRQVLVADFTFQATNKQQLSSNWKFHIPDLKVGTLDQLVGLSDDLGKLDNFVEQITRFEKLDGKVCNIILIFLSFSEKFPTIWGTCWKTRGTSWGRTCWPTG